MATATARDRLTVLQMRNPVAWTAITHHRTHKGEAMDFREAPCLLGLYADGSPNKTVMKATQAGATEYLICLTVVSAMRGLSVFYVLPTYQLVSRVVKNRFDPTIERTPFYGGHVRSEQGLYAGNVSLKHIGQGAVAFIGSNSRAGFTEFPADLLIVDELDECDQDNLNMAWERLGRSKYRWEVDVGNPTIPSFGIAAKYEASTKGRWAVWCDSCERFVRLDFFRNVVRHEGESDYRVVDETWEPGAERDCRVVCDCGKPINPKGRGRWESDHESSAVNGYHIDKLIAGRVRVSELIARLEAGIKSQAAMQRFWNGDLGLPFMAPGANIGHDDWNACIGTHGRGPAPGTVLVGIDVGSVFHVVTAVMGMDRLRIIQACELTSLRELMQHLKDYGVRAGVIDALPERRISQLLCTRHRGMFMAFFAKGKRDSVVGKTISVDRTAAVDQVKDAVVARYFEMPVDAASVPNLYEQLTSSVRIFDEKADQGRGSWSWESGTKADHYLMAFTYLMLARNLAVRSAGRPRLPTQVSSGRMADNNAED